ncbi:TetR family transcriptional regulator C-terminal domain-containing protein [Thalassovita mediterranea]|jgi:TetR/AcrR family transcriptional regulator|uniref:Rut operon repressor n=1 Tax=Thalassovita mediterranea TaxID=340021 RepID=A0A0P1GLD6_9RHOB|nr:TetR family transcriptional regulator C-terminal domain-containing protein [Thalassovita mediterranea]MCG7573557.1 TetR family transcriptional regulator C-terminal domain-containing protein [Phaeobacter sp. CNT1-3]CUH82898.1 Rut operon repressor [Thalassovita mediterranea]SIS31442.1 transcriptional regulator, TetR family [Thalassovita mediterranea]
MTQSETPIAAPAEQSGEKKLSRIQQRNRTRIMEAALDVFSAHGFRGATLDQIAKAAGLSKPNLLYYFDGKEAIHVMLLNRLMETWLNPLQELDPNGDPLEEVMGYIHRKVQMSREFPRESRLFANEILQGAPRMKPHLESGLKPLVDEKTALLRQWMDEGKLAAVDPRHLLYSIWATTQHYADFEVQIDVLSPSDEDPFEGADAYLDTLFRKLLTP